MQGSEGEAMSKSYGTEQAYGCIFCITGKEQRTAESIERACEDILTVVARQTKFKTKNGKKQTVESILFPGYIFFKARPQLELRQLFLIDHIIAVLGSRSGDWQLHGSDALFVQWLFSYEGLLPLSKAFQVGDRVHIHSGPLKDLEGHVLRVDRRNRSGQVALRIGDWEVKTWLGFEWIDEDLSKWNSQDFLKQN